MYSGTQHMYKMYKSKCIVVSLLMYKMYESECIVVYLQQYKMYESKCKVVLYICIKCMKVNV